MVPGMLGRYSAHVEESFVVFLIGMRVNRVLAFNAWLPVGMGKLLKSAALRMFRKEG